MSIERQPAINLILDTTQKIESYEQIKDTVETIDGYMVPGQEEFLFNKVNSLPDDAIILEVGSYKGRSTAAMAFACTGTNRRIYCVDLWNFNDRLRDINIFEIWQENLSNRNLLPYVQPFQGNSAEILSCWSELTNGLKIDFTFIDGSHEYIDAFNDFGLIFPHMKPGGWMAFHDVVESFPGCVFLWHEIVKFRLTNHEYSSTLACGQVEDSHRLIEQLEQSQHTIHALQSELGELKTTLQQELQQTKQELEQTKQELEQTEQELQRTKIQFQHSQAQLEKARNRVQNQKLKIEALRNQFREGQTEIEAMKTSKFWKIRDRWFKFKRRVGLN